jgi:hypothetical protein
LSYRYAGELPPQNGLFIDADDLSPVVDLPQSVLGEADLALLEFADYVPSAVGYRLRLEGRAAVLSPRGGLELWVALRQGVRHLVSVEPNPLVVEAAGTLYAADSVELVREDPRSFAGRSPQSYDLVVLPLTTPYRPIRSGAYSLTEDYRYTVEAFGDYLSCLRADGLLMVSRWLQIPPSESLRAYALTVTALESQGGDPASQIIALRGYTMMTLLVKKQPFTRDEIEAVRRFAGERAFDLVMAPGLTSAETNRYSVVGAPTYHEEFTALLEADDRDAWYWAYPFDVRPPTDTQPFFGHYYKWSQAPAVLAELGKTWQPFGGAGYFVVLALLALSVVAAILIIGLPILAHRRTRTDLPRAPGGVQVLTYFGLLGVGYLFVEIPAMQQAILFLGEPAYAVTAVLFTLLFWSGVGSWALPRARTKPLWVLGVLAALVAVYAALAPLVYKALLPWPFPARLLATFLLLAPLGVLMGLPFPAGLSYLSRRAPSRVPWAWAVNGASSVVASILSALIALSAGFAWVLAVGAVCYAVAGVIAQQWGAIDAAPDQGA